MTAMNSSTAVLSEREGAVLTLTLNRPGKSNSLHPDLIGELSHLLRAAEADSTLSVVVLTGAGKSFCAGLDLSLLVSWTVEQQIAYLRAATGIFQLLWSLPQPVIAAVNGPAIAGGFDLAAFCDIRLAAREALFGQAEINLGLVQIVHPLYKSIGLARAKELAMTGENISGDEAYRIGLVNHVYAKEELMPRAMELARLLASKPRGALFETKRLTRELIDLDSMTAFEEINDALVRRLESEEHRQRVAEVFGSLKKK